MLIVILCSFRGLFLIDPQGMVKHMSVNDLPVGRSVEETLRLVKAFQFVETHGEVCPASWTPKSPTVSAFPMNTYTRHLHDSMNKPLGWSARSYIALTMV